MTKGGGSGVMPDRRLIPDPHVPLISFLDDVAAGLRLFWWQSASMRKTPDACCVRGFHDRWSGMGFFYSPGAAPGTALASEWPSCSSTGFSATRSLIMKYDPIATTMIALPVMMNERCMPSTNASDEVR